MPDDFREKYHAPHGLTPKELIEWRSKGGKDLHSDVNNFRSLMPFLTFEDGKLTEAVLYPIRLNMHDGLPALADAEEAKAIVDYMKERNEPYGTKLTLEDGIIRLHI